MWLECIGECPHKGGHFVPQIRGRVRRRALFSDRLFLSCIGPSPLTDRKPESGYVRCRTALLNAAGRKSG